MAIPNSYDSLFSILNTIVPHAEQAKKDNLWQFTNCENIERLIEILLRPLDTIHQDVIDIQASLPIDYTEHRQGAYGEFLDLKGKGIGRVRGANETDLVYKDYLHAQILENTNQGTLDEFLIILAAKLRKTVADRYVYATEIYPAQVHATVAGVPNVLLLGEKAGIGAIAPAGVRAEINVFTAGEIPFGFAGSGGLGFAADRDEIGGVFVGRYRKGPNIGIIPFTFDDGKLGGKGFGAGDDNDTSGGQFVTGYGECH